MSLAGEARKKFILEQLRLKGQVSAGKISEILKISTESVRKYLCQLEKANKLQRVYGGAISLKKEPDFQTRRVINLEGKNKIGRIAASLVEPGDVLALDEGTTPKEMLPYLCGVDDLTIVTGSLVIIRSLIALSSKGYYKGKAIFIGGSVDFGNMRVCGPEAGQQICDYNFTKVFIVVDGLDKNGVSCYDQDKGFLSRLMMKNSTCNIVLCDKTKIGRKRFFNLADFAEINYVVSDVEAPAELNDCLQAGGVKWINA